MNRYVIYDKKTGAVKGTFAKYVLGKDEPVAVTEAEIIRLHGQDFGSARVGALKLPPTIKALSARDSLKVDVKERSVAIKKARKRLRSSK